jgi:hypothetical protein|tara:strand:+ start:1110 stop:4208 length:3099 start_codon:yes stop_codon:yes gene_type:complete
MSKKSLTEGQVKQIIKEEFAEKGIVLTEEEINELFGSYKRKLIKQIKTLDPNGDKLVDKYKIYSFDTLKDHDETSLKQILKDLGGEAEKKGWTEINVDLPGVWDILAPEGVLGAGGEGTLLGGEEVLHSKERRQAKDNAKAEVATQLTKLKEIDPEGAAIMQNVYTQLDKRRFPNEPTASDFKSESERLSQVYEAIVKDFETEKINCVTANIRIAVLRYIVIYFQDYRTKDQYYYRMGFSEQTDLGAKQGATAKGYEAAYSKELPLGLLKWAAGFAVAGFVVNSDFFQSLLTGMTDMEAAPGSAAARTAVRQAVKQSIGNVSKGDGIIKTVRAMGGEDFADFGRPGGPALGALTPAMRKLFAHKGVMTDAGGPAALEQAITNNLDPHKLFVAGDMSGKGGTVFGLNPGNFEAAIQDSVGPGMEAAAQVPAATLKNQVLKAVGAVGAPFLLGLAASMAAAGGAAAFWRRGAKDEEGKALTWGSRISYLKKKVDTMKDVPCDETEKCPDGSEPPCEEKPPPPPPPPGKCPSTDEEKLQGKTDWNEEEKKCDCPEGYVFSEISPRDDGGQGKCIKDEIIAEDCGYMGLRNSEDPEKPGCICPDTGKFVPNEHWDDWKEIGWCKDEEEGKCPDDESWDEELQKCVTTSTPRTGRDITTTADFDILVSLINKLSGDKTVVNNVTNNFVDYFVKQGDNINIDQRDQSKFNQQIQNIKTELNIDIDSKELTQIEINQIRQYLIDQKIIIITNPLDEPCPEDMIRDDDGKCVKPGSRPGGGIEVEPKQYEITVDGADKPSVEKTVRDFAAENGLKVGGPGLDDLLGRVEQWMEWTNARAYGLARNADVDKWPKQPRPVVSVREEQSRDADLRETVLEALAELREAAAGTKGRSKAFKLAAPAAGEEPRLRDPATGGQLEPETGKTALARVKGDAMRSGTKLRPRTKGDVRDGKILFFVNKNGAGAVRKSLKNFLRGQLSGQQALKPFTKWPDAEQTAALALAIADFVYGELQEQGAEVQQQQQQQEAKELERWKTLSGIK